MERSRSGGARVVGGASGETAASSRVVGEWRDNRLRCVLTVSPLTPALSPLRGEGVPTTAIATPSPLNGERAGVRGENGPSRIEIANVEKPAGTTRNKKTTPSVS